MAKYFVITRAADADEAEAWNDVEASGATFLRSVEEDSDWITWKVDGDFSISLSREPWVRSLRMVPGC